MWKKHTEKSKEMGAEYKKGKVQDSMEYKIGGLTQAQGKGLVREAFLVEVIFKLKADMWKGERERACMKAPRWEAHYVCRVRIEEEREKGTR